jgi:hypothetical protein
MRDVEGDQGEKIWRHVGQFLQGSIGAR